MSGNNKYEEMVGNPPPYNEMPPAYSEYDQTKSNGNNSVPNVHIHSSVPPPVMSSEYQGVNMMGHHNYGATICDQPLPGPVTQVILIGGCPSCRAGVLEDSFSVLGVLCAILFFPIGILCCLALKSRRCSNCGASF